MPGLEIEALDQLINAVDKDLNNLSMSNIKVKQEDSHLIPEMRGGLDKSVFDQSFVRGGENLFNFENQSP